MSSESTPQSASTSFQIVLGALRHGDVDAWQEILRRYSARLIALARSRLFDPQLRQKLDPEDVVQSVWRTFYRRHQHKTFEVANWDALWGLLVTLTVYRVCRWNEHYQAQKRSLEREVPLHSPRANQQDDSSPEALLTDAAPSPLEVLQLADLVQEKLATL